jgi:uncharacterized membrane protein YgcG
VPRQADFERGLDRLYGLPDGEFTAARNDLARELKRAGDADGAEQVRALKKPSRPAAAINRAVRANRREAKRLLDAAAKLGEAQEKLLAGGDRRDLAKAVERERAAVDKLMAAVEPELGAGTSAAMATRARDTLHAVASDPELREELAAGRVVEDRAAVGLGPLMTRRGGGRGGGRAATGAAKGKAGGAGRGGGGRGGGGRAGGASAAGGSAAKRREKARRALRGAESELEDAQRRLRRATSEQAAAAERLEAANAALSRAERELAAAEGTRDKAQAALDSA